MQTFSSEALILDVFDLHESDRIVTFLTRERGKKRGVAQGSRRKHSRYAGQLQPLAKAKVSWYEKEGRDLVRLTSVEMTRSAVELQETLEGLLLGSYLADHMMEFAQENEESENLFRLLEATVEALRLGAEPDLATRYFEAWVLRLSGIFPPPTDCPACGGSFASGAVLPPEGDGLVCRRCSTGGLSVSAASLDFLRRIGRENLEAMGKRPPDRRTLGEVAELCAQIRRRFLSYELKSFQVIRETLAGI